MVKLARDCFGLKLLLSTVCHLAPKARHVAPKVMLPRIAHSVPGAPGAPGAPMAVHLSMPDLVFPIACPNDCSQMFSRDVS